MDRICLFFYQPYRTSVKGARDVHRLRHIFSSGGGALLYPFFSRRRWLFHAAVNLCQRSADAIWTLQVDEASRQGRPLTGFMCPYVGLILLSLTPSLKFTVLYFATTHGSGLDVWCPPLLMASWISTISSVVEYVVINLDLEQRWLSP